MRFVHCSDIHLLDLSGTRPHELFNKRITGAVNLLLKRRRRHDDTRFEAIKRAAESLGVDRLVVTGDLTNLSLPSEFRNAARSLEQTSLPVTVIPGNHDAYVGSAYEAGLFETHMGQFMEGERPTDAPYPFVNRTHEGMAFIGVTSAVPTPPMLATGEVGAEQLAALELVLSECAAEGRARVVLIHHPPVEGASKPKHDLIDRAAFAKVVARCGAELILHGHEHKEMHTTREGPGGSVPVFGVPSGTSVDPRAGREGGFALFEFGDGVFTRTRYAWGDSGFTPVGALAEFSLRPQPPAP